MKKAKLDILEEIPDLEIELPANPDISLENQREEEIGASRWAFNKMLIVGLPVALIVALIVGLVAFYVLRMIFHTPDAKEIVSEPIQKALEQKAETPSQTIVLRVSEEKKNQEVINLRDFMIDLKDVNGQHYLLLFDIALDINGKEKGNISNKIDVARSIIFSAAQRQNVVALRTKEERQKLKNEIRQVLDHALGEGTVKNVFFTNYCLM